MNRSLRRIFATLSVATSVVAPASAGVITFDDSDGYNANTSLSGQPGWAGAGGMWNVIGGSGGDNFAQSTNPIGDGPFSNTRFTPTAAFLGGSTDATGLFNYSFELRNDGASTVDDFNTAHLIILGNGSGGTAVRFNVLNNGRVEILHGGPTSRVLNINGNQLDLDDATGRFLTFEGVIDFDNGFYTVAVDGVSQVDGGGSGQFGLLSPGQTDFGIVQLQRGGSTSAPDFRQLSLDNIAIVRVPEPTAIVAAVACFVPCCGVRRRSVA